MILEGGFWGKKERFFVSFSRRAQNHKEKKKKRNVVDLFKFKIYRARNEND